MICTYEPCTNQQGPGPLCPSCEGKVYRDLNQLADYWADLEAALPAGGGAGEKVSGTKNIGLPINSTVAAVRHEIAHAISYYAQVIVAATTTLTPPQNTPDQAQWIAKHHHHITRHQDPTYAAHIRTDTAQLLHQTQNALDADTKHTIPIGKCIHPQCTGWINATYREKQTLLPNLTCNQNPEHTWTPAEYPHIRRQIQKQKETAA